MSYIGVKPFGTLVPFILGMYNDIALQINDLIKNQIYSMLELSNTALKSGSSKKEEIYMPAAVRLGDEWRI